MKVENELRLQEGLENTTFRSKSKWHVPWTFVTWRSSSKIRTKWKNFILMFTLIYS